MNPCSLAEQSAFLLLFIGHLGILNDYFRLVDRSKWEFWNISV